MRALILNRTSKRSPEQSYTDASLDVVTGNEDGDHEHDRSEQTARTAASSLAVVARALATNLTPLPPG